MGYSVDDTFVRVDFFREGGKWYDTESIKWKSYDNKEKTLNELFREYLNDQIKDRYSGMWAVCLKPYHENSYPLMIKL